MALIDELKERRSATSAEMDRLEEAGREIDAKWKEQERLFGDLDTAIRALDPLDPPTDEEMFGDPDFAAEQETACAPVEIEIPEGIPVIPATEWTEPLSGLTPDLSSTVPDEQDDASEFSAMEAEGLGSSLIAMGYGDDEPLDAPGETVEYEDPTAVAIAAYIEAENAAPDAPALNADMQDEREQPVEGYAPVTNPEAHIQAVEAERFAQPTNPDADAIARAHDWYDPKAVAERNKFNPFSLFRAKEDA